MTTVNEIRLTKIANEHGYDDAEYCPIGDKITISRDFGTEGFAIFNTSIGWIAGKKDTYEGFRFTSREDGSTIHALDVEKFAADNKSNPAYAFFPTPEAALVDILDYGIEASLL